MSDQIYTVERGGKVYELQAPEGTSPEALEAAIAGQEAKTKAFVNQQADKLKVVPGALYEAATAIPRLLVEVPNFLDKAFPSATPDWMRVKVPGFVEKAANAEADLRRYLTPEAPAEKLKKELLTGGLTGLIFPGGSPAAGFLTGVGGAAGAETAGQLSDNPFVKILGAILGGGVTSLGMNLKPSAEKLAKEALDGVTPQDLKVAKERMLAAQQQGIPLNLSQAMPKNSNVDAYVEGLAGSKFGTSTREVLDAQLPLLQQKTQEQLKSLPGQALPQRLLANEGQQAASDAIKQYYTKAGEAWRKFSKNEIIPQKAVAEFDAQLAKYAASIPGDKEVVGKQLIEEIRRRLTLPRDSTDDVLDQLRASAGVQPAGKFRDNALDIKAIIQDVTDNYGPRMLNTGSLDAATLRHAQAVRALFSGQGGVIERYAPGLAQANKAYEAIASQADAVKKSITGDIAGRRGAIEGVNAPQGKLFALFDAGSTKGSASEILTLERDLRKAGQQETFLNAAKSWFSDRITKAIGNNPSSRPSEELPGQLLKIFGDPRGVTAGNPSKQAQGLQDTLVAMARAQGLEDATYVKGIPRFLELVTDLARRPGAKHFAGDVIENARPEASKTIGAISIMTPLRQPALAWGRLVQSKSLTEIDRLMNSPEGIDMLQKLAKQGAQSKLAQAAVATFLSAANSANAPGNPPAEDYTKSIMIK